MLDLAPKRVEHGTDLVERAARRFSEVVDQAGDTGCRVKVPLLVAMARAWRGRSAERSCAGVGARTDVRSPSVRWPRSPFPRAKNGGGRAYSPHAAIPDGFVSEDSQSLEQVSGDRVPEQVWTGR